MLTQNLVSNRPPIQSLLLILLIVFIGFFLGNAVGLAIVSSFYDGDILNNFQNPGEHPDVIGPLLALQSIASLIGFIIFPALYLIAIEHKPVSAFFPPQQKTLLILFILAVLGITFMVSISPLVEWNINLKFPESLKGFETWAREYEDRATSLTEALTSFNSLGDLMIGLFVIALLPAIGEELVFRGLFQNEFFRGTGNIHLSIWLVAIIFSAIHLQFYGFIPRMLLGALFGYLYYWSGNLLIPMFAHFFNNAFGVIMIHLHNQKVTDFDVEDNTAFPVQYVIINLILTGALLYYIWKHYHERPKQTFDSPE